MPRSRVALAEVVAAPSDLQSVVLAASAVDFEQLHANALRATALLKAMANPSRLIILCQLARGEKSVGELEDVVGLSQSSLSQHLAVLRNEAIVRTRREAQSVLYSLASNEAQAVMSTLYAVFCAHAVPAQAAAANGGKRRGGVKHAADLNARRLKRAAASVD